MKDTLYAFHSASDALKASFAFKINSSNFSNVESQLLQNLRVG